MRKAAPEPPAGKFRLTSAFKSSLNPDSYAEAFHKIKAYIDTGDCYQINLTREFSADFKGDPWSAYLCLREVAAAPFSAYMDFGSSQFLCLSPERLLAAQNRQLQTQPIKGTAARSDDPDKDLLLATTLQGSAKNRAENIMIVDLLRNDFSKSCQTETVITEPLCDRQGFRPDHHLGRRVPGNYRVCGSDLTAPPACFLGAQKTATPNQRTS